MGVVGEREGRWVMGMGVFFCCSTSDPITNYKPQVALPCSIELHISSNLLKNAIPQVSSCL